MPIKTRKQPQHTQLTLPVCLEEFETVAETVNSAKLENEAGNQNSILLEFCFYYPLLLSEMYSLITTVDLISFQWVSFSIVIFQHVNFRTQ